ncbi:MAG: hypothetical protein Q8P59_12930 [Dehalococcoidia bacterium]|nr:hypothetical protein [Dehalococcoidia bacterium]
MANKSLIYEFTERRGAAQAASVLVHDKRVVDVTVAVSDGNVWIAVETASTEQAKTQAWLDGVMAAGKNMGRHPNPTWDKDGLIEYYHTKVGVKRFKGYGWHESK